jgi:hypothetical protein
VACITSRQEAWREWISVERAWASRSVSMATPS